MNNKKFKKLQIRLMTQQFKKTKIILRMNNNKKIIKIMHKLMKSLCKEM